MTENEKVLSLIKTTLDTAPLNEQLEEAQETVIDAYNDIIPILDDLDVIFEFDKYHKAYDALLKLSNMESYRAGFKAGVLLFTH